MVHVDDESNALTPAEQILAAAHAFVPALRDRIIEVSPESIDEDTWLRILDSRRRADSAGTDSSGVGFAGTDSGDGPEPSFDDPVDLLTVLAEFDGSLTIGALPLRAQWARESIAMLATTASAPDDVDDEAARTFTLTTSMLLESIGLASAAPHSGVRTTVGDDLEVEIDVHDVYSARLAAAGISPIIGITLHNAGGDPVVVTTLEAQLASRPDRAAAWLGPEIEIPAGDTVRLGRHELAWAPEALEAAEAAADELSVVIGASGRSRALTSPLAWLPEGGWTLEAPAELLADVVESAAPEIIALADGLLGEDSGAEERTGDAVLMGLASRAVDARFGAADPGDDSGPGDDLTQTVRFRSVSELSEPSGRTPTRSERALLIAAVLENLDIPVALIVGARGLRAGIGHGFDTTDSAVLHGTAAVLAELSGMATDADGVDEAGVGESGDSPLRIVDIEAARRLIGVTDAGSTAGSAAGSDSGAHPAAADASDADASPLPAPSGVAPLPATPPRSLLRWKSELLDLSYRNPLLRLPRTRGAGLQIPEEMLREFEDSLSAGRAFRIRPKSPSRQGADRYRLGGASGAEAQTDMRSGTIIAAPYSGSFDSRLKQLAQEARRSSQENGFPSLYVTIGTMEWTDLSGGEGRAPLFLSPVEITGTPRTGYGIHLDPGGETQTNHCLVQKLRNDVGGEIPTLVDPPRDDSGIDVDRAFDALASDLRAAGVDARIDREVRLVNLGYGTLPMWRDLQDNWRQLLASPVADHLARRSRARFVDPQPDPRPEGGIDPDAETSTWLPADADSSQLEAIVAATNGNSFVLEGPPGTGKSQTITNMIADGLMNGRRLLFVAEKQAALDVVQRRLEDFGLSPFVLDVHAAQQSAKAVRDQLAASLTPPEAGKPKKLAAAREELRGLLERLRAYPEALHGEDSEVWAEFQGCLEAESEQRADAEWRPEDVDARALFARAGEGNTPDEDSLAALAKRIRRLRRRVDGDVSDLGDSTDPDVTDLRTRLRELADAGLTEIAAHISRGRSADELAEAIRLSLARERLARQVAARGIDGYGGPSRDAEVRAYLDVVTRVTTLTRSTLAGLIGAARRWNGDADAPGEDFVAEVGRSRGGSIRQLFAEYGDDVLATMPCVLMSPAGVAKHLPVDGPVFDTVIFDEASQITTASALGAIGRARAAVIVGDSQQMPPSSEFAAEVDEQLIGDLDEGDGASGAGNGASGAGVVLEAAQQEEQGRRLESILSQAVSSGFERRWLTWHYRSRSEELIAFSNRKYYQGRLASFPAPPEQGRPFAIDLRFVGGDYTKVGGMKVNRKEAEAVVAEVRKRLLGDPGRSIAVVTFNASQRAFIEDALESSGDPFILDALRSPREPLMVKNVDNVQGDERDIVLFSIGYAPDPLTGRLNQSFGPINRAGGERRFNVAITRAREEIVVFTSLRSTDLDLRSSRSRGLEDLRDYLGDAERGTVNRRQSVEDRVSFYREAIAGRLRERGAEVEVGLGTSTFLVDLAVRSGDGWLAVLLDPPSWAHLPTVWDRDGLPIAVLEGSMGWKRAERVLLADWLRDSDGVLERIVEAVPLG